MVRTKLAAGVAVVALAAATLWGTGPAGAAVDDGADFRRIHFPVEGKVSFSDDFGDPRSGGRSHEGNDLMGTKLQKLLATTDGKVSYTRVDAAGLSGNMLSITDAEGWTSRYIHINNDSPGTDDGLNPAEWIFAPGITNGTKVKAGQHVAFLGDSGNAEGTAPHLHFELRRPDGTAVNPWTSLRLAQGLPAGTRCAYPENPKGTPSAKSGAGYWTLGADGGIFSFGAAAFYGSTGSLKLNKPIVGMAATTTGKGYWLVASDGGIFSFGDAAFHGSTGAIKLNRPVVAMAPTPTGKGYWLLADDGGMFAFGDAGFKGSVPGAGVKTTVVSMAPTKSGAGYWLLGADGGVFNFGDAAFKGSLPGEGLCQWPKGVRVQRSATGQGYWLQGADGTVWAYGDAKQYGSLAGLGITPNAPVIDLAVVPPTS